MMPPLSTFMKEPPFDPETLAALDKIAWDKGLDIEQVFWTAIDQYILSETGQNN